MGNETPKKLNQIYQEHRKKLDNKLISKRDFGNRFEALICRYLKTTKNYNFSDVWLWDQFPYRHAFLLGSQDLGIDIVAKTTTGDYYAIQCKFRSDRVSINKNDLDSFASTSQARFSDGKFSRKFAHKILFTTASSIGAVAKQLAAVFKIHIVDLRTLDDSDVNWGVLEQGGTKDKALLEIKTPLAHQEIAIEKAKKHYATKDRGKLIMACGTGKTYTSLKILEDPSIVPEKGFALYLVPSIALMSQTIRAYNKDYSRSIHRLCICSDAKASATDIHKDNTDLSATALLDPATTDLGTLVKQWNKIEKLADRDLTIVFSTYQSIQIVSDFAKETGLTFDLVICDEAHRTASVRQRDKEAKTFAKVHDNDIIPARKRLYMTATKRVYDSTLKKEATLNDTIVYSMDDIAYYGETFYELSFGEAIEKGLLSDYEVVIFHADKINYEWLSNLSEAERNGEVKIAYKYTDWVDGKRKIRTEKNLKISIDKLIKVRGCIDVFQKKNLIVAENKKLAGDEKPMETVLIFDNRVKYSKAITGAIQEFESLFNYKQKDFKFSATHIDGSMHTLERSNRLSWLEDGVDIETGEKKYDCRAISNVKCLSEGIDVPALDGIVFLGDRTSIIDIVQSVGRVMRKAPSKKVGYIIIPVVIDPDKNIDEVLEDSSYSTIWRVLNALKSHDSRLDNELQSVKFFGDTPRVKHVGLQNDKLKKSVTRNILVKDISVYLDRLQDPFKAKIVEKVGVIKAWKQWANDIAELLKEEKKRIRKLASREETTITRHGEEKNIRPKEVFEEFVKALKEHLNQGVTKEDALDILAQQSVTKEIFDILFPDYFKTNNQVGIQLQKIVRFFKDENNKKLDEELEGFCTSVKYRVKKIADPKGKQQLLKELYDDFFGLALPNLSAKLGIVYTPVEVVDFIIQSVDALLKKEFGHGVTDEHVNILDPFTGTGTFITRLLQSDVIKDEDFIRKYQYEVHASELVLLAYYIADTNIESVYTDEIKKRGLEQLVANFNNILLRDTFVSPTALTTGLFPKHYSKLKEQDVKKIRVIIGNPPYSAKQKSVNDNLQNEKYKKLEDRIKDTYIQNTTDANAKNSLYDSYFKAFRWASDRISADSGGIIGFVTNGAWLDTNAGQGFRRTIEKEFSSIYVFNLRGNARTSGEIRKKERDNVFGQGTRTPICITFLIKKPKATTKATIRYHDIGDYLTRDEKLEKIKRFKSILNEDMKLKTLKPDKHGDWINQRKEFPKDFIPLFIERSNKKKFMPGTDSFFIGYSLGALSARDPFVNNYSKSRLEQNVKKTINHYISELERVKNIENKEPKIDGTKGKWTDCWRAKLNKGKAIENFDKSLNYLCVYRPFSTTNRYFGKDLNKRRHQTNRLFPSNKTINPLICLSQKHPSTLGIYSVFMANRLIDNNLTTGQGIPLNYYPEEYYKEQTALEKVLNGDFESKQVNVTDYILNKVCEKYPKSPPLLIKPIFFIMYMDFCIIRII